MPDLDYAKVTGRFGLSIGDTTADTDYDPDLIWCTEGRVLLTPLNTFVKVTGGTPTPFTMGNAVYEANIAGPDYVDPTGGGNNGAGRLVFNGPYGQPFVNVVDLTSDKVNPKIGTDAATHRVTFVGVKAMMPGTATKVDVSFPSFTARITAAGPNGDGVNDLTLLAPVIPGELQPIYQGPAGLGIDTAAVDDTGDLVLTMTNGVEKNAGSLADVVSYTGVSLKRYGLATATDLTTVLAAAVADGKRHLVIPDRAAAWPLLTQFTYAGADRLIIEWERGARVTVNKDAEAAMDLTNTTLRNAHFTSPYTGPTSSADWPKYALATPGQAGENFQSPARAVILRDNCRTEGRYYHEYATTGIQILGAHVKLNGPLEFKGMRHRTGWAEGIHIDGGLGGVYDFDCFGSVTVTDSDRAIEVEERAYDITFHGGSRQVNVFPNGYPGQPTQAMVDAGTVPDPGSKYANYTFTIGVHSHSGGGGSKSVSFLGEYVLENCGSGPGFIRSSGTNDADLPRDCYVEKVVMRGRGLAPGNLMADLEGFNNRIGTLVIEDSGVYSGGTGGTFVRTRFGNGRGCKIDVLRAEKFSLPLVTVETGADSGGIGRIEALDGKLSGPGYLVDVAGPRFRIGELRARDVAGTLGYVRLQATALDPRIGSQDLSVKAGETIEPIVNLSARADLEVQSSPVLSAANRAGRYVNLAGGTPNTAATLGVGTLRLVPVYIPTKITIDRIGGEVTVVGDAGSKIRLGIFTDASGLPGDPIVDATIAGDAVAVAEATIAATTLERGWYWIGGAVQLVTTTQPTVRTISSGVPPVYPMLSTTASSLMANTVIGQSKGGVTAALSSFGTTPSPTTAAPRVFVRLV